MKKTISLLLALVMCLSLCACGNSNNGSNVSGTGISQAIYPDSTGDKIQFDDLILAEDDKAKISLVDFYVSKMFAVGNSDGAKCATLKIENKTDYEMSVYITPYLNNENLELAYIDGNTVVEAGRVGRMGFSLAYGSYPNSTDLEALEDLYNLEFTFDLTIGFGTANSEKHKVTCSVADALNGDNNSGTNSESEPMMERFAVRNDVYFGDSMDEVATKEAVFDIDYESAGENGYICAQAESKARETVTFEGIDDAYLFYYFGVQTEQLEEMLVMLGYGNNRVTAIRHYETFLEVYFNRYGVHLTEEQKQHIPLDTYAYEYATTSHEDSQLEKHTRWLLQDGEEYVILDVVVTMHSGNSYYTFVGMRHVTAEEITTAGGNLSAIYQ